MKFRSFPARPDLQRGAATLVIALVTLVLVTLVTIYSSRSVLLEQKIMSNEARSRQAFEAAEAGLASAIGYFNGGMDRDLDGILDANVFDTDADGIGNVDTADVAGLGRVIVTPTDLTGELINVQIVAQGFSDDSTATRTVTRVLSKLDPLPRTPDNPLTTRGTVVVTGAATIRNPEGSSTIWSGGNVDLGSNNATHTEVADPTDPNYPGCMDTALTCSTTSSSNKVTEGLDIVEYDVSLENLSADDFFLNFFGMLPDAFHESMVTMYSDSANADADVQLATNEVIWIDGDATFDNNTTVGCAAVVTGVGTCSAANTQPSILIVDGNAAFNGTPHFYGLVFVTGTITTVGDTTVYGALMTASGLVNGAGGNLEVTYDSDVLQGVRRNGPLTSSAGSWRDF